MFPDSVEVYLSRIVLSVAAFMSSLFVAASNSGRSVFFVYPITVRQINSFLFTSS